MRMISANKSIACLLLMFILTVSVCVCADSRKAASQEQPKYELKSDIINFDYSQLAYPSSKLEVGIKTDTARVPKKIVPGKVEERSRLDDLLDGLLYTFQFYMGAAALLSWVVFLPYFLVEGVTFIYRKIKKIRKKHKN